MWLVGWVTGRLHLALCVCVCPPPSLHRSLASSHLANFASLSPHHFRHSLPICINQELSASHPLHSLFLPFSHSSQQGMKKRARCFFAPVFAANPRVICVLNYRRRRKHFATSSSPPFPSPYPYPTRSRSDEKEVFKPMGRWGGGRASKGSCLFWAGSPHPTALFSSTPLLIFIGRDGHLMVL